jgi:hypothetical protein
MQLLRCLLLVLFFSCSNKKNAPEHGTDLTCINSFIRCIYEGRFDEAEMIMTTDTASTKCLQQGRFNYNQVFTKTLKQQYKNAAVTLTRQPVNDSVVIFECKDPVSGTNKPFKTVKKNNEWRVEFSYTCSGNL